MSDKKLQHTTNNTTIDYYNADIITANDYYPGGMQMPGRKYTQPNSSYRYGFNGKEKSDEVYGDGNVYDYGFRIYNPRLGRFLSTDPLTNSYPWYTPYQFAGNMPIVAIDLDGLEEYVVTNYYDKKDKLNETVISVLTKKQNGSRVNMQLQKDDGTYITDQNVLIRNVSYDGTTSYKHQSSLNKQQKNIVEKATKEIIDPKKSEWAVGVGGDDGDGGENLESEKNNYNKKFELSSYSSRNIIKPAPIKAKVTPPKTDNKPLPITKTSTSSFGSSINFWSNTAATQYDGYKQEVADIVSAVNGKSDYSITIFGNFEGEPGEKFSDKGNIIMRANGYKTYGDLALARANKIKSLLVEKGLDSSKIKTTLGTEGGGMSADYKITTTTTQ